MISHDGWLVLIILTTLILWAIIYFVRHREKDEKTDANWSHDSLSTRRKYINPPWKHGQYVSYFHETDGGKWLAIMIKIVGNGETGGWILTADFKTASGDYNTLLISDPTGDNISHGDFTQIGEGERKFIPVDEMVESADFDNLFAKAIDLLIIRKNPGVISVITTQSRDVCYPCDINKVKSYTIDYGKFIKHYDFNPRVYVTGVACLITERDNKEDSFVATAFGEYDATTTSYTDYVDFSHSKRIEHGSFSLTYPATWFLRRIEYGDNRAMEEKWYVTLSGGDTLSCLLGVHICRGGPDLVAAEHSKALAKMSSPQKEGDMIPEPIEVGDVPNIYIFTSGPLGSDQGM